MPYLYKPSSQVSLRGVQQRSNLSVLSEIATLPLVARNDNAPALNVFVFNVHFCHSGLAGIFLHDPTSQEADRKILFSASRLVRPDRRGDVLRYTYELTDAQRVKEDIP